MGSGKVTKGDQRLEMSSAKRTYHIRISIHRILLQGPRGSFGLDSCPIYPEPESSEPYHFCSIEILLISIPEIDRTPGTSHLARSFPCRPIILRLPLPIVPALVLIRTRGDPPQKLLLPAPHLHRFRTCSAISSCCPMSTRTGVLSDSARSVFTIVWAA